MINFIKNDFKRTRNGLNELTGKEVPLGIFVIYYVVVGLLVLPLYPFVRLYIYLKFKKLIKELEE